MNLVYSPEARTRLRFLPPEIKRGIKQVLEDLSKDPYCGRPLQRELTGFWSLRFKGFRIIYRLMEAGGKILIHTIDRRERIYQDFSRRIAKV